jgi:hypothetical protein
MRCALTALATAALAAAVAAPVARAEPAAFAAGSSDGSNVFFTTKDPLVPGDTDRGFPDVYERAFDAEAGVEAYVTRELSTGPTGGNDAYPAFFQGASADGGEVLFSTEEPLVPADVDHAVDVYVYSRGAGTTLVSRGSASCEGGGCGNGPRNATFNGVTPGGGAVFFQTVESLTPEDTDEAADLYVRDLEAEPPTTALVSRAAASCETGGCGNGLDATFAGASTNGKRAFFETAESLTPADTDGESDIYVRDLESEPPTTVLVSTEGVCPEGAEASECRPKFRGASAGGSRVFFTTSEQLSPEDEDEASDLYVWEEGTISLVSTGSGGGNGAAPAIFKGSRAGGAKVFFQTTESLTPDDTDGAADVYMRDLEAEPPTTSLVSQGDPSCEEAGACGEGLSNETFAGATPDGGVVFVQTSEKLAPQDADGSEDVYARDLEAEPPTTALVSQAAASCETGGCGNGEAAATFEGASASGIRVLFSTKEALTPADEDESKDIYARNLGTASTALESAPAGICPLPEEVGCDATFSGASEDGTRVFFTTVGRLGAEDVDSYADVYERAEGRTRLVSAGNSVELGPPTPTITGISPGSSGETLTPSVHGREEDPSASIKVYTTSDCSGTPTIGTVAEFEDEEAGVQVTVEAERQTSLSATATDEGEVTSGCSNAVTYTHEYTEPPPSEEGGGGESGEDEGGSGSGSGSGSGGSTPAPAPAPASAPLATYGGGIAYAAPVTRITFGPAFKTRARQPVFRFVDSTGQPGTRFVCKVDRHAWKACASPAKLKKLHGRKHVFRVKGVNATGVWEARPVKRAFKLVRRRGGRSHKRHAKRRSGR